MNAITPMLLRAASFALVLVSAQQAAAQPPPAPTTQAPDAQPPDAEPPAPAPGTLVSTPSERADELHRQAKPLLDDPSRFEEARVLLAEAYSLKQSHDIAANYGAVLFGLERYREAAEVLSVAATKLPTDLPGDRREKFDRLNAAARAEIAVVRLQVSEAGATLLVDNHEVGLSPLDHEVFLDPGQHIFAAKKGSLTSTPLQRNLIRGDDKTITLTPPGDEASSASPAGAIAIGVIGLASMIVGAALLGANANIASEHQEKAAPLQGQCGNDGKFMPNPGFEGPCQELDDLRSKSQAYVAGGGIALGVGGALLIGGIIWGTVAGSTSKSPSALLLPTFGPRHAGLIFTGTF